MRLQAAVSCGQVALRMASCSPYLCKMVARGTHSFFCLVPQRKTCFKAVANTQFRNSINSGKVPEVFDREMISFWYCSDLFRSLFFRSHSNSFFCAGQNLSPYNAFPRLHQLLDPSLPVWLLRTSARGFPSAACLMNPETGGCFGCPSL